MKSMTGFACREQQGDDYSFSVELRGYNNRFLEINIYLPSYLSSLESRIRRLVAETCTRGRIDVTVRCRELNAPFRVTVNTKAAAAYGKAVELLAEALRIDEKPDIKTIMGLEGVLEIERPQDEERYWERLLLPLREALGVFDTERIREGRHTLEHILSQIAVIEDSLNQVCLHADEAEAMIKENLRSRFAELLGDKDKIDENRVLSETAVLLMKYTIAEEISRIRSHLSEFRVETEGKGSPGKKLDFLCQELNREINTIGSKTPQIEVSRAVVNMKNALENVREQLRNIE
ncbi:MAG: YicC family protein [Treponema sp.]|jgi:uncharacterized protein (TIGR00255 family)|nr:YicC family protein [Treponema sp.]